MRSGGEKKNQLLNFDVPFTPKCSDVSKRGRLAERGERVGGHPSLCSQEAEHQGRELLSRSHSSGCCASRIKRDVTKYWASASGHAAPVERWWLTTSAQGQRSQTGELCFKGIVCPTITFLLETCAAFPFCGIRPLGPFGLAQVQQLWAAAEFHFVDQCYWEWKKIPPELMLVGSRVALVHGVNL